MEIKVVVQKVSDVTEDMLNLTARDETGGITHFNWKKKNGVPAVGDEIGLRYMRTSCKKLVGLVWKGQTYASDAVA